MGCRQETDLRVPVAGRVYIDERPLARGTIRFVPEEGRPASSAIMADGTFNLSCESVNRLSNTGVLPGKYRVAVAASEVVDDKTIRWIAPSKYADFRTSGLDVNIDRPVANLVIRLTSVDQPADGSAEMESTPPGAAGNSAPHAPTAIEPQAKAAAP